MADRDFPTSGMDYFKSAIAQAVAEGMSAEDIFACAEHASGPVAFADAINELARMIGGAVTEYERGRRDGYEIAKAEAARAGWHLRRYDLAARDHDIASMKEASE